mmetsp:Transcript_10770/g.16372  ORF Transcript_10770/g.16372 Transcript_10770/m.16372 type:complete len:372 (-) Transcript_10770:100-1215(-)
MGNSESSLKDKSVEVNRPEAGSGCPMEGKPSTSVEDGCPVRQGKYKNSNQYNVYSQVIDPRNQMPSQANQQQAPSQQHPLSTDRVKSHIPKGGTDDDTWAYPSPQMFWNALVRKGKSDGATERDMDTVVAIHNNMNENTWQQVMAWESLHPVTEEGREPKLLRFMGRPDELSPKAWLKTIFGHPAPFDRHDWIVDRGGQEVRYVIDYYHDESQVNRDKLPNLSDPNAMHSIFVDVRPAIDTPEALADRAFRMPLAQVKGNSIYNPPPFFAPAKLLTAEKTRVAEINAMWEQIKTKCEKEKSALSTCDSEEKCGAAAVALQRCNASIICPSVVADFDRFVQAKPVDSEKVQAAYSAMSECLESFEVECRHRK